MNFHKKEKKFTTFTRKKETERNPTDEECNKPSVLDSSKKQRTFLLFNLFSGFVTSKHTT